MKALPHRHPDVPDPPPKPPCQHPHASLGSYASHEFDMMVPFWYCSTCKAKLPPPGVR
jgi:hypothetical protein